MSFGSSSFGSASLGGASGSLGLFFSASEELSAGTYRRSLTYNGTALFFQIIQQQETVAVDPIRLVKIYSHNDPGETPQLQTITGEANYSQTIIGAAKFIVVDLELSETLSDIGITISGSEYFQ